MGRQPLPARPGRSVMGRLALAYLITAVVFLGLDVVWLTQMGPRLYAPLIGPILATKPSALPAILFYALHVFAIVYFCVSPALQRGGWSRAALNGAILGFSAYGTYDLTNQATLRIWSTRVTVFDLGWGALATAVAAAASVLLIHNALGGAAKMEGRRFR